ncbi:MAG: hypothetical protein M3Y30_07220 [Gemmatimonadota bacterium]|nr:hypothetical protein [Gemmatimonadota bacterium]
MTSIRAAAHDVHQILRFTAVSWILATITFLLVVSPDQSLEGLRFIGENAVAEHRMILDRAIPGGLLLIGVLASLATWYWARVALYVLAPGAPNGSAATQWSARHLPRIAGTLPLLGIVLALWRATKVKVEPMAGLRYLEWLAVLAGILVVTLYLFFIARRKALERFALKSGAKSDLPLTPNIATGRIDVRQLPVTTRVLLAVTLAFWLLTFALMLASTGQVARNFGTASVLLLACTTWTPIATTIMYYGAVLRFPLLRSILALALLFAVCNWTDNRMVRYSTRVAGGPLLSADSTFRKWLASRPDRAKYAEGTYPVFFVAAEGGGLRAAYYTSLVLSALQDHCPAFAMHTFAISGASGGSVGASVFAATVAQHTGSPSAVSATPPECRALADTLPAAQREYEMITDTVLGRDFLTPVFGAGLYQDLLQRILPYPINRLDRARALERGLEDSWDSRWTNRAGDHRFARPYSELWADSTTFGVPLLLINTARVETGERMVISPFATHDAGFGQLKSLADVNDVIDLPLSTAVFLGARFPYVTPEGAVPVHAPGVAAGSRYRYVDGGYFDDSAVLTLMDLLTALGMLQDSSLIAAHPVVLRIGFSESAKVDTGVKGLKFTGEWGAELLSPLRTLLNVRVAYGADAIQRLHTTSKLLNSRRNPVEVVDVVLHQDSVPLVLGWQLSRVTRALLLRQVPKPRQCSRDSTRVDETNECAIGRALAILSATTQSNSSALPATTAMPRKRVHVAPASPHS